MTRFLKVTAAQAWLATSGSDISTINLVETVETKGSL